MPTTTYTTVNTRPLLRELTWMLKTEALVSLDIETTGLDPWAPGASIVSISLTFYGEETYVLPLDHIDSPFGGRWRTLLHLLCSIFVEQDSLLLAHNAGFDLTWLMVHSGVDLCAQFHWDTQTVAHLLNENQSKKLKSLALPLMGNTDWGIDVVTNLRERNWFDLAQYNALDTIATLRLYKQQVDTVEEQGSWLMGLTSVVLKAQRALLAVRMEGIPLRRGEARAALAAAQTEAAAAADTLMEIAGQYGMSEEEFPTVSWEATSKWFIAFMERACDAGDAYVDAFTPNGRPSWNAEVLEKQARQEMVVPSALLRYRHGSKQAQFIESWLECSEYDGRIHANFNIARTKTGRLSSSDPNMQQVSRELKHLFGEEGSQFCEVDFSQVELRVAAELMHRTVAPNNPMMQAYLDGEDLHRIAATLATGGSLADVTKEDRQKGKAINFGFLFGMGAAKFVNYAEAQYGVKFTLDEAHKVRNGFFSTWEGIADWHEYQRMSAKSDGFVETLYKRRRRLPDIYSPNDRLRSEAERQAINSPVQGTASDMMLDALGRIHQMKLTGARVVGTVHDSVLLTVTNTDELDKVTDALLRPRVQFATPIEVEVALGPTWGDYTHVYTKEARA